MTPSGLGCSTFGFAVAALTGTTGDAFGAIEDAFLLDAALLASSIRGGDEETPRFSF